MPTMASPYIAFGPMTLMVVIGLLDVTQQASPRQLCRNSRRKTILSTGHHRGPQ